LFERIGIAEFWVMGGLGGVAFGSALQVRSEAPGLATGRPETTLFTICGILSLLFAAAESGEDR
jgi:hypothetical protein